MKAARYPPATHTGQDNEDARSFGLCPDLSAVVQDDEGGRGNRTQPGVLAPGNWFEKASALTATGGCLATHHSVPTGH